MTYHINNQQITDTNASNKKPYSFHKKHNCLNGNSPKSHSFYSAENRLTSYNPLIHSKRDVNSGCIVLKAQKPLPHQQKSCNSDKPSLFDVRTSNRQIPVKNHLCAFQISVRSPRHHPLFPFAPPVFPASLKVPFSLHLNFLFCQFKKKMYFCISILNQKTRKWTIQST